MGLPYYIMRARRGSYFPPPRGTGESGVGGLFVAPDVPALLFLRQRLAAVDGIVTNGQALCQHVCYLGESYFRLRMDIFFLHLTFTILKFII